MSVVSFLRDTASQFTTGALKSINNIVDFFSSLSSGITRLFNSSISFKNVSSENSRDKADYKNNIYMRVSNKISYREEGERLNNVVENNKSNESLYCEIKNDLYGSLAYESNLNQVIVECPSEGFSGKTEYVEYKLGGIQEKNIHEETYNIKENKHIICYNDCFIETIEDFKRVNNINESNSLSLIEKFVDACVSESAKDHVYEEINFKEDPIYEEIKFSHKDENNKEIRNNLIINQSVYSESQDSAYSSSESIYSVPIDSTYSSSENIYSVPIDSTDPLIENISDTLPSLEKTLNKYENKFMMMGDNI